MTTASTASPAFTARPAIGLVAAISVIFIWSGWLVASRAGVQSALTVYDIMAFRFGIASLIALPVVLYLKSWRGMTVQQIVVTSLIMGIPYTLILFTAFEVAPAAHAAVFMNGVLPALTMLLGLLLFSERPGKQQLLGAALVIVGAGFAAFGSAGFDIATTWWGDLLFIIAGGFFAVYMVLNRMWHLSMTQIWLCGSIMNAIVYVPVWWLFLPSGISQTPHDQLILQMTYQGIVPNIIGMVLIAVAVRHIGAALTAAMMSGVPAVGSLLGYIFLGESLTWLGILSLIILTPGIILASMPLRKKVPVVA